MDRKKRAVQFGAGAIGRGFLGQLYSDSGWETVFVDVVPEVVDALNARGGYTVEIVGPGARVIEVTNVRAVDGRDASAAAEEVARADLVGTSVGQAALPAVAKALARGIARRAEVRPDSTLDVLICENLLHASRRMRELLVPLVRSEESEGSQGGKGSEGTGSARDYLAGRVGLVETVISRMIPVPKPHAAADLLRVAAEDYNVLPVDRAAFRGPVPDLVGLLPVDNFRAHEERKLYAHNCGHALAAYFGAAKGYTLVREAVEDAALRAKIERGLWEAGEALCRRHGFTREEHAGHLDDLLRRFANPALGDTIARVGRDPVRKLARGDRLVGAALLAMEHGITPDALAEGIAAAMDFRPSTGGPSTGGPSTSGPAAGGPAPGDPSAGRLADIMRAGGPERVLREVCGLESAGESDRELAGLVLAARRRTARA